MTEMRISMNARDAGDIEDTNEVQVSTQVFYEPKFLQIFSVFRNAHAINSSMNRHIFSLCLDYLIPFGCWARESDSTILWIKLILEDNYDTRPEVRNGLSMIIMYSFAAAKADCVREGQNMFTVLQDTEGGLGIVNKTSLKIYNDPFLYFGFLKNCITGLIDGGIIPENERVNQPKKARKCPENKDELSAFYKLREIFVTLLDSGDRMQVEHKIRQISTVWQHCYKTIRNNWFNTALSVLHGTYTNLALITPFVSQELVSSLNNNHNNNSTSSNPTDATTRPSAPLPIPLHLPIPKDCNNAGLQALVAAGEFAAAKEDREMISSNSSNSSNSSGALGSFMDSETNMSLRYVMDSQIQIPRMPSPVRSIEDIERHSSDPEDNSQIPPFKLMKLQNSSDTLPSWAYRSLPLRCLRFEKISCNDWIVKEIKIFDISLFLSDSMNSIYLINENNCLTSKERSEKKISSSSKGFSSFYSEILQRDACVASWKTSEFPQLHRLLGEWSKFDKQNNTETSLASFWQLCDSKSPSASSSSSSNAYTSYNSSNNYLDIPGVLAFETLSQIGIMIRENADLKISQGCWRLIYPSELGATDASLPFAKFLSRFFPQLEPSLNHIGELGHAIVKYHSRNMTYPLSQPPPAKLSNDDTAYQTLGTLNQEASTILERLDTSHNFHEFWLILV